MLNSSRARQRLLPLALLVCIPSANALLLDRGQGMIYDTDTNLLWLQDWNYAKTSGYDSDGLMTWNAANTWAGQLSVGGFHDWRMPQNITANEFVHIYYNELGNTRDNGMANRGPFLAPAGGSGNYWFGNLYRTGEAWTFTMNGNTSNGRIAGQIYATAVRLGDVSPVPEPTPSIMLAIGLALLGVLKRNREWVAEA